MGRYYAELLEAPDQLPEKADEQAPVEAEPGAPGEGPLASLQRLVGNRAVAGMLSRQDDLDEGGALDDPVAGVCIAPDAAGVDTGSATAESDNVSVSEGSVAPAADRGHEPAHPAPARPGFDLAGAQQILTTAFGNIKTIVPGSIQLLSQDDFQAAYDAIYGSGQYSWAKYVAPRYGNLNGFASGGVNYINRATAGLHTIVHEMLHNNCASDFIGVVGSRFNEGATEILTQMACGLFDEPAPVTYPGESPCVQAALDSGLPSTALEEAYLKGGAQQKIAAWVDTNCVLTFAEVKEKMEANDWAAARAGLQPKTPLGGVSG